MVPVPSALNVSVARTYPSLRSSDRRISLRPDRSLRGTLSSFMKDSNRPSILRAMSYGSTGHWLFEVLIFSPLAYFTRMLPPKFSGRP